MEDEGMEDEGMEDEGMEEGHTNVWSDGWH